MLYRKNPTLLVLIVFASAASTAPKADVVLEWNDTTQWNELAYDIECAEDQFTTFKSQRAFAMLHLAQHDAPNAIVAVAQAAHDVLHKKGEFLCDDE